MSKYLKKNYLTDDNIIIYGKHAVFSALSNKNRFIRKILLGNDNKELESQILVRLKEANKEVLLEKIEKKSIEKILGKNVKHQGILMFCKKLKKDNIETLLRRKKNKVGVLLDKITDPNNVGALYRSANCFNLDFVINLERGSVKETGTLLNTACGAYDNIDTYYANNLVSCIKNFKKNNWWILGTDADANLSISNFFSSHQDVKRLLVVLGSEGDGVRRLTRNHCDFLVKIPIKRENSLNVSNAAAIFFYEINKHLALN